MKAKRYLIYYYLGVAWVVITALLVGLLPSDNPTGLWFFVGGFVGFGIASAIEGLVFYNYLQTWDTQLLGEYANIKFGSYAMWGLRRLSFTREDNGDPELQEHKLATRAVSTVMPAGFFVFVLLLTITSKP